MDRDTIFAPASGAGVAGIAVIRVSGPGTRAMLAALAGLAAPRPRHAHRVRLAEKGRDLDDGLALFFPAPHSFTGEDVAELHVHGGRATIAAVLAALGRLEDLRPAEAGEFSRRAFENGKMDLTAAEGLADLIAAETEAQRRQALAQADGVLAGLYDGWRARLVAALAHLEAHIEFAEDEPDVPADLDNSVLAEIGTLSAEIGRHLADGRRGERLRDGVRVAIVGAPNAGKSSLLNRLVGRDAAIVSTTAGTTRDVIEVHLDLGGWPVIAADTAGLADTADAIEAEGIRRARARAEAADIKLAVFDAAVAPDAPTLDLIDSRTVVVANKCDRAPAPVTIGGQTPVPLCALSGDGIDALLERLGDMLKESWDPAATPALTRERHRRALEDAAEALDRALYAPLPDLAAEDLRLAARAIGRITGRVDIDELLDRVFADFCIGK